MRNNNHENILLQRAWNKYGEKNFSFELVEECSTDKLLIVEQTYIDSNSGGYNIASAKGGDFLSKHPNREKIIEKKRQISRTRMKLLTSDERKEKFGNTGEKNGNWKGGISTKRCPKCNNIKCDGSHICDKCDFDFKLNAKSNMIERMSQLTGEKNYFYGKKHSDETKEKIRQLSVERMQSKELREKLRLMNTGKNSPRFRGYYHTPWGIFESSSLAQKAHEYMLSATIHRWCNNSDKIITINSLYKSPLLKQLGPDVVGKTYREIGFWFEPID